MSGQQHSGTPRGLPEPDWDPLDDESWREPFATWDRVRAQSPVAFSARGSRGAGPTWSLLAFDDIVAAARDTRTFSNAGGARLHGRRPPLESDPPEHGTWRRLLMPYFGPARMAALETASRDFASALLEPLLAMGGGDAAHAFSRSLPPQVLLTFLGQPPAEWAQIKSWCEDVFLQAETDPALHARFEAADFGLWEYSRQLVADRQACPRDPATDPMSGLLAARIDDAPLHEELVVGVVRLLIAAGHDSTTTALGMCLHYLARHSDAQQRLRADPSLVPAAVEEMLRLETPVLSMPRFVTRETEMHGRSLQPDERVMLYWAAGNRDPRAFDQPDVPLLDRKPNQHLAFGFGIHKCVGAPLARLELRVAMEEWLRRTRAFGLESASAVTFEPWHRFGPRHLPVWIEPSDVTPALS